MILTFLGQLAQHCHHRDLDSTGDLVLDSTEAPSHHQYDRRGLAHPAEHLDGASASIEVENKIASGIEVAMMTVLPAAQEGEDHESREARAMRVSRTTPLIALRTKID